MRSSDSVRKLHFPNRMHTIYGSLKESERKGTALCLFNFSELGMLHAIVAAARELGVPVFLGLDETEREYVGIRQAAALVRSLRDRSGQPIFSWADQVRSIESAVEIADAGFDVIGFDASAEPYSDTLRLTEEAVEAIKSVNRTIWVQAELGPLISSDVEGVLEFVGKTGVDLIGPSAENRPQLIGNIKAKTRIGLTLHGDAITEDEDFAQAIEAGADIFRIQAETRQAWREGIEASLRANPGETATPLLLKEAQERVKKVALNRLRDLSVIRRARRHPIAVAS